MCVWNRSTGPLSFGFSSLENSGSHGANNGKFFAANPVAELAVAGAPPPQALSTELLGAAQPPPTTLAESPPTTSSSSAAAASAKPRACFPVPTNQRAALGNPFCVSESGIFFYS